ncbi:hypothetical protein Ae201684_015294 [Aphanomyces euteiches]|uniref:Uncharacterized protein n=1 Tax=Aphanomyces euteiches TaxID=100861 RepID=A0A6G0WH45_9STRA|nr:hypothetical protein Ae201684_015294 [Aphanomyces euteiches]
MEGDAGGAIFILFPPVINVFPRFKIVQNSKRESAARRGVHAASLVAYLGRLDGFVTTLPFMKSILLLNSGRDMFSRRSHGLTASMAWGRLLLRPHDHGAVARTIQSRPSNVKTSDKWDKSLPASQPCSACSSQS